MRFDLIEGLSCVSVQTPTLVLEVTFVTPKPLSGKRASTEAMPPAGQGHDDAATAPFTVARVPMGFSTWTVITPSLSKLTQPATSAPEL